MTSLAQPFWRRRLLVPALLLAALNGVAFLAFTLPRTLRERSLRAHSEQLAAEVATQRDRVARLERRAEVIAANTRDTERFYSQVVGPREARLVGWIREIEGAARQFGLSTGHWNSDAQPLREAPLVRFRITLPLTGSYDQLVSFLRRLETSQQFLIVEQIQLRERERTAGNLDVWLATYFSSGGEAKHAD